MSISTSPVQIGRRPSPITLTDTTTGKIAELLADEASSDSLALRVAVRPGGCSGYSYDMFFDTEISDNGLQGAGFHVTNPNATRTCGCGSSFS